nr:uncharacterized protein LOC105319641 isoform X2 [Crassostrea gigas]
MDPRIFFLVSIYWVFGVSIVDIKYRCNDTFLPSNGSISSEYYPLAAATCDMVWPNNSIGRQTLDTFVGLHKQGCPARNQCSPVFLSRWLNGTISFSIGSISKPICEINATGCCENNTMIKVGNCSSFHVYFHRNSTGCDEAHCYENGPDVYPTPGKSTSGVVLPINTENGTSPSSYTTSMETQMETGNTTLPSRHTTSVGSQINAVNGTNQSGHASSVSPIKTGSGTNRSGQTSLVRVPVWSICLITISIASNIFLTLGLVFLWLKNKRRTHAAADIRAENTEVIKIGNRIK